LSTSSASGFFGEEKGYRQCCPLWQLHLPLSQEAQKEQSGRAPLGPTDTWPLQQILLLLCELVGDTNRLADLADRFLVVLLDAGIDDKCRPGELACS
jgi:hypothetical protein